MGPFALAVSSILCIVFFVHGSESTCDSDGKTYQIGESWEESSQYPECSKHVCLENGTFTTSRCDPTHNDVEVEPAVEQETTVKFSPTSGKSLTTTEIFFDDNLAGCTVDNRTVKVGEQVDVPGRCYYRACAGQEQWIMKACGLIGLVPGWILTPDDPSKPYPECCGRAAPLLDIIPDVIQNLQWNVVMKILYDENTTVDYGNELTPTQVKTEPTVNYTAGPESWYLLAMTDPDAPSRRKPESREFLHWMVGNIPGEDLSEGEVLAEYVGSGPPQGTGPHRYVFLLYQQPGNVTFEEPLLNDTSIEGRTKFSISKFSEKYNLGDPVGFNFFVAQYDKSVPEIHKQLGLQSD